MDIDQVLKIEELRGRGLEHTRQAYRLLPRFERPRILDIGCGRGQQTIELALMAESEVIGIDTDQAALSKLRQKINKACLGDRVKAIHVSLLENQFEDNSFHILWEEGVFHLLDATKSLPECRRLLKPDGYLVMHETIIWFEGIRKELSEFGFQPVGQYMLPKHFWWTDYGAPLEERILAYGKTQGSETDSPKLAKHKRIVAEIRRDPDRTDSGIYLMQKLPLPLS
jgi:SAM-dependent methyltransferase